MPNYYKCSIIKTTTNVEKVRIMNTNFNQEDKMLSGCEAMIMKIIWDAKEDIAVQDLLEQLRLRFDKDYKRSTIATFLLRLAEKGFVETYRNGYFSYVHAIREEEDYKGKLIQGEANMWFGGSAPELMMTLTRTQKISKDDLAKLRRILDELDD